MLDLISTTEELHYENYRQQQMETRKFGEPKVKKLDNPKFREEEEQLRKKFTDQVKAEEARFRQWEQHVSRACGWRAKEGTDALFSSLPSATASTRTWRWRTVRSSSSRSSWTTSGLEGTVPALAAPGGKRMQRINRDCASCRLRTTTACLFFDRCYTHSLLFA